MAHSSLATISVPAHFGNYTKGRQKQIRCITIHHMAGVLSAQACGNIFAREGRNGSSHYGIGNGGEIAWYVDEADTAWTNSNWPSNCESITIETSNSALSGEWPVSDAAYNSLIKLVADIAKRNNLGTLVAGQNLTWHSMFVATSCPGNYLRARIADIAAKANAINAGAAQPAPKPTESRKTNEQLADEVIAGKWGNGADRRAKLTQAGYSYDAVQAIVNARLKPTTTVAPTQKFYIGQRVTLKDWVDYNGTHLRKTAAWYTVAQMNGARVVLTSNGVVYAAVNINNLQAV